MTRFICAVTAAIAFSACAGVDDGGGGGGGGGTPPPATAIPEAIAGDLRAATFSESNARLTVQITLDSGVVDAVYARNSAYDVPGYTAFTLQDDPLDRYFTGLAAQSSDGSVQAVVVADGGQFTKYFGGVNYQQIGRYTPSPAGQDTGLVSYAGSYVGLTNLSTRQGTAAAPGANPDLLPERAGRVTGDVFLNVGFADNSVNGAIINRRYIEGTGFPIDTVFLIPSTINPNGSFSGTAQDRDQSDIGTYSGTFGGINATSVAGGVRLTGDFIPGVENEEEYGIFVLDRCGPSGPPAVCDIVNPQ